MTADTSTKGVSSPRRFCKESAHAILIAARRTSCYLRAIRATFWIEEGVFSLGTTGDVEKLVGENLVDEHQKCLSWPLHHPAR